MIDRSMKYLKIWSILVIIFAGVGYYIKRDIELFLAIISLGFFILIMYYSGILKKPNLEDEKNDKGE